MKPYSAPEIIGKGDVTKSTPACCLGVNDPKNPFVVGLSAFGSLAFQL